MTRPASKLFWFASFLVALQLAAALFAAFVAPYDPLSQDVVQRLKGPSALHLLGTDQFGRDTLSRIVYRIGVSLAVSATAVGDALILGGAIGLAAAYCRGLVERMLMRSMDVLFAFPVILLADPERRKQGVAAVRLADAEKHGAGTLESFRDNAPARRFYERHGWRCIREYERAFDGIECAFVAYEKH